MSLAARAQLCAHTPACPTPALALPRPPPQQVCELFEVSAEQLWAPARNRQLLAALLGDLRDAHWARAAGCSPAPATMTPLALGTALSRGGSARGPGGVGVANVHAMSRAVSAARKRSALLPCDAHAQLQLALLHYFAANYDDAWLELGVLLEQHAHSGDDGSGGEGGSSGGGGGGSSSGGGDSRVADGGADCARDGVNGADNAAACDSSAEADDARPRLSEGEVQQARVLMEKCRLQLSFGRK
eukprot:364077-Chlamydomonas_euryale.AAC.2